VALGDLGGSQVVQALAAALQDESLKVRQSAVRALERIGRPAIKELTAALTHKDSYVRQQAAEAFVRYKEPTSVPALIVASKDSELKVRRYSLWALAKTGDARAVDAFIAALGEADDELQWRAEEGLVRVGPPAVPALLAALKHEQEKVRLLVIKVLGKLGDEQALPALRQIVADRHNSREDLEADLAIRRIVSRGTPKAQ
jgi:HEAT repeat protein